MFGTKLKFHNGSGSVNYSGPISAPASAIGGNQSTDFASTAFSKLRRENPSLASSIMAEAKSAVIDEAIMAERQRISHIDAIASHFNSDVVYEAKYGKNPCTAAEMVYRAAKERAAAKSNGATTDSR